MQRTEIGTTGLRLPPLGFGAFKIGRNQQVKYPHDYDLPDDAAVDRLLNGVLDAGINFIDTAPAYGLSEERIGRALSSRRDDFVISTKVGETFATGKSHYDFSGKSIRQSVQRSLRRLKRDVLDVVFLHAHGNDCAIQRDTDAVETLCALKDVGEIRAIGLSGKTPAGAREAFSWADVLMVEFHPDDVSHRQVMQEAASAGIGVIVKKGLASGRIPAGVAIPFVLSDPAVNSLVIGGLDLSHIRENLTRAAEVIADRAA